MCNKLHTIWSVLRIELVEMFEEFGLLDCSLLQGKPQHYEIS